jgi:hypothetical protein
MATDNSKPDLANADTSGNLTAAKTSPEVPVVTGDGVPLVDKSGNTVTSTETPDTVTSSGSPAVASRPDNTPSDAKSMAQDAVPEITTSDAAPAGQGTGVGSAPTPAMASDNPNTPQSVSTDKSVGSEETLNPALTTTVDATTIAKAKAEQDAGATSANTPAAVLSDAVAAADINSSNKPADPDKPLVLAPQTGAGIEMAKEQAAAPVAPGFALLPDTGVVAADANNRAVVTAAPAAGNSTSDGQNAGAVDPTGYVAPVRVSAAGVPANDPNLVAASTGDLNTTNTGATGTVPAGTSDKPDASLPSQGVDATTLSTNSRIGGNAQQRNPGALIAGQTSPADDNARAQTHATIAAMTGSPLPASTGDKTLAQPVAAGDTDAAGRVADLHTQDTQPVAAAAATDAAPAAPAADPTPAQAVQVLSDAGVLPAPVVTSINAQVDAPKSESELDADAGPLFIVDHMYEVHTSYKVHAADADAAEQAVKDGKAYAAHTKANEDWDVNEDD